MAEPIRVTLRVSSDTADDQQIDEMTRQLRAQLLSTDAAVDAVAGGTAPPGSKAIIELAALGGLLLTLAKSPVLASIIDAVSGWLKQRRDGTVRVEVGGDVLELSGEPTPQQATMSEEFLRRHAGGDAAPGVTPAAGARVGSRNALLVASWQFEDPGLQQLRAPAHDVAELARVLGDPAIGGFGVQTVVNQPAPVINEAVEDFFADRDPDELLLLYFSGHGIKDADGDLYLAATATKVNRLGATAVAADFINRRMSRSRSRRVVLLLDCCYAGAFGRGMVPRGGTGLAIGDQFNGRGRAVITASSAMEYAFEGQEVNDTGAAGTSVFTTALIDGLTTGEADRDQDGFVALDELYDYVYDRVREVTPNQTPGKWTFDVQGDLYIARRNTPVRQPAALPRELTDALQSPLSGIREGAAVELARLLNSGHEGTVLAARAGLELLSQDDSRRVSAAARAALATIPAPRTEPIPIVTPTPAPAATGRAPVAPAPAVAQPDPVAPPPIPTQAAPTPARPAAPAAVPGLPRTAALRGWLARGLFALAAVLVFISNVQTSGEGIDIPTNAWIFPIGALLAAAVPNRLAFWPPIAAVAIGISAGPISTLIPLNASDPSVNDDGTYLGAAIGMLIAVLAGAIALTARLSGVRLVVGAIGAAATVSFFGMVLSRSDAANGFMDGSNNSAALAYLALTVLILCALVNTGLDLRVPGQRLATAVGLLVPILVFAHFYTAGDTGDDYSKDIAYKIVVASLYFVLLGQAAVSTVTHPGQLAAVRISVCLTYLVLVRLLDDAPHLGVRVTLLLLATAAGAGALLLSRRRREAAQES